MALKHLWAKMWTRLCLQIQTSKFDDNNGQVTVFTDVTLNISLGQ